MKILIILLFSLVCNASSENKIVYGFSSGILPNDTQEFVYRGFLMALKKYRKINVDTDLKMVYSNSGSLLSTIEVAKDVIKQKPQIVTGFPSSFESKLAAPILKNANILTVFASSSNLELSKMGPTVFSSAENILYANKEISKVILNQKKILKGIVIYNPNDFFSINQLLTWKSIAKENKNINLDFFATSPDGKVPQSYLTKIKSYNYIVTTLFPNKSYDLFRFLDENKIDLPVYTNSSWYKMDFSLLKRFFLNKKSPVFTVEFKNKNQDLIKKIESEYFKVFKSSISPEVFVGYDLGIIVGGIIQSSSDNNTVPLTFMKSSPCFDGSPFGRVCFDGVGGFSKREVTLININENI